jgi:hypothetical protein
VGGDGAGEGAPAQEVLVVGEANAVADARTKPPGGVTQTFAILAMRGSGKTSTATVLGGRWQDTIRTSGGHEGRRLWPRRSAASHLRERGWSLVCRGQVRGPDDARGRM